MRPPYAVNKIRCAIYRDPLKSGLLQVSDEIGFGESTHLQCRSGAAVKHEAIKRLDFASFGYVSEPMGTVLFYHLEFIQFWKMFDRLWLEAVGNGKDKQAAGFEKTKNILKGLLHRGDYVFKDFRGNNEITGGCEPRFERLGDVESRFLMEVSVPIVESAGKPSVRVFRVS